MPVSSYGRRQPRENDPTLLGRTRGFSPTGRTAALPRKSGASPISPEPAMTDAAVVEGLSKSKLATETDPGPVPVPGCDDDRARPRQGEVLVREGDTDDHLYVVVSWRPRRRQGGRHRERTDAERDAPGRRRRRAFVPGRRHPFRLADRDERLARARPQSRRSRGPARAATRTWSIGSCARSCASCTTSSAGCRCRPPS